jgi:hypothetical protein
MDFFIQSSSISQPAILASMLANTINVEPRLLFSLFFFPSFFPDVVNFILHNNCIFHLVAHHYR